MKYLQVPSGVAFFISALFFLMAGCDVDNPSIDHASDANSEHVNESQSGHHQGTIHDSHMDSGEHHMQSDDHQMQSDDHHMDSGEHYMDSNDHHMESGDPHTATFVGEKPDDARHITITATDFEFSPAEIRAKPGEKLYIELVNEGNVVHMWQLRDRPATHIHTPVGETSAKVVVAPESPGEYEIVCGTPGHEDRGMVGTLKVSGDN